MASAAITSGAPMASIAASLKDDAAPPMTSAAVDSNVAPPNALVA